MSAKFVIASLMIIGSASVLAQLPGRLLSDPNDPQKTRTVVSRSDRDRLGLNERTWTGIIHPDVSTAFLKQGQLPEDPMERVRFESRIQFKGSVYVQVHLRHTTIGRADSNENKAAIDRVQRRVLDGLTATEFHVTQKLTEIPGLLGFANQAGLAKLAQNPDVIGVCLDDKPMPDGLAVIYKNQFPDVKPKDVLIPPGASNMKAEWQVRAALKQSDRVLVLVNLRSAGEPLPALTHIRSKSLEQWEARERAVRDLQDRVLSTLTAEDFWLNTRLGGSSGFAGYVNSEGLKELLENPEVKGVGLDFRIGLPKKVRRSWWSKSLGNGGT